MRKPLFARPHQVKAWNRERMLGTDAARGTQVPLFRALHVGFDSLEADGNHELCVIDRGGGESAELSRHFEERIGSVVGTARLLRRRRRIAVLLLLTQTEAATEHAADRGTFGLLLRL